MSEDIQQALGYLEDTIHESIIRLCTVHEPHLFNNWQHHTCGECGWASVYKPPAFKGEDDYFDCRHVSWQDPEGYYLASTPACPAFVERPKEEME